MAFEIRAARADEFDRYVEVDHHGFGAPAAAPGTSDAWRAEIDRTRVAFDGNEMVAVSRNFSFELTLPGPVCIPAAAVSGVAVLPTHRRRGILTEMMSALHDDARAHDEPVSMLTASESTIYGRFGYGVAAWRVGVAAERGRITFRDDIGDDGSVRFVDRDEADKVLPAIYDAARVSRAGMVSRPPFWWRGVFWGQWYAKDKAFYVVVHSDAHGNDDGFVAYEIDQTWGQGLNARRMLIWDMQTADARVHAALWRYAFGVDLVATVAATNVPVDDPLRLLVHDGRRVRVEFINDHLWVAVLDAARVLGARRYATEGTLAIEVDDVDGTSSTFALDGGPDGAQCTRTTSAPDLSCASRTLASCILGGNRWSEMARAGLVEVRDPAALARADVMFSTSPAPALLSMF